MKVKSSTALCGGVLAENQYFSVVGLTPYDALHSRHMQWAQATFDARKRSDSQLADECNPRHSILAD